ncbi:sensor histidine kinase [Xanthobacter aminoxidans]|uniref:sensor histidine kinase n=1 Tax=Xanthobacter aminoxidans TaxID=186280 RepID=UPI002022B904|nr:HAMP domain-containing sensor histidine kinase [Xanthobacter aminoxidans]MCL8381197.1 cache domain-containing protein [Xanthobacter aminoxidans]
MAEAVRKATDAPRGVLARLRSVRMRLLAIALLPTLIILPAVLALVVTWWTRQFDRLLISKVNGDLTIARQYLDRLRERSDETLHALGDSVAFARVTGAGDNAALAAFLDARRKAMGLDFLYLIDADGHSLAAAPAGAAREASAMWPVERRALAGTASTEIDIFGPQELERLSPQLAARAHIALVPTPGAVPTNREAEDRGMVVQSGTPVELPGGGRAALVGGVLLNQNLDFIDTINDLVYRPGSLPEGSAGTATLFVDDVRVSTNVRLFEGRRALGTRVSKEVRNAVLGEGRVWLDRAFVVSDWYISAYEPVVDSHGKRIGMLYVGFLEAPFLALKRASLAAVAVGFLLVAMVAIPVLLRWAAAIFRPLEAMNATISAVEGGALSARTGVAATSDEIGRVAHHLDDMLDLLQERDAELRRWTEELDRRVAERTRELEDANAELAATQRQLVMSEKLAAIGEITAGVAHEINNPVAVIQGNLDVARDVLGSAAGPVKTEFNLIDQQVHRINVIVSKLLQFARPAEFAGHLDPVAPGEVVGDALLLVQHLLSRSEILVARTDGATRLVMMNRVELQQVLINLMVNAVHAMPQGGTLTVTTRDETRGRQPGVGIEVADTGTGIPEERIGRVFDPFFTTKPQGGTGLGLSISYTLIERAGGTMAVESPPGSGAVFSIWLPEAGSAAEEGAHSA